jgi:hypothetical protein
VLRLRWRWNHGTQTMPNPELTRPDTVDTVLQILFWAVMASAALWAITETLAYFNRRAYNLTHAESGGSKNIKPDFLKVDHEKREI